uniref:Iron-sulfur cluster assembly 2 homolog, mitochondrial n=1 Tax=Panagrolaimus davidi TaxID=227884 RepID=A0A914QJC5_9BILA
MSSLLKPKICLNLLSIRNALRPPPNLPYLGLYRTEGEVVQRDELLVYHVSDRATHLLKADCDGTVMITREKVEVDPEDPKMQEQYAHRNYQNLFKLTYNVVPLKMSNSSSSGSSNAPLILTEKAVNRLKEIAKPNEYLRILVEGGGCSGFEYKLSLDDKLTDEDLTVEKDGVKVVVDKMSLEFIKGSTVDYAEEMMRSTFRLINNPLADKGCSCGSSFSVKM